MTQQTPRFWNDLVAAYESGTVSAFVLHGNTQDHVLPGVSLASFLAQSLGNREIVVFYDRANGFSFPLPSMEDAARRLLNLDAQQQQPVTGALAALMGSPQVQGKVELPRNPNEAATVINDLLRSKMSTAVIINHAETILPAQNLSMMPPADRTLLVTMLEWSRFDRQAENPLILICRNLEDLHPVLRSITSGYMTISIALPDLAERQAFIAWWLAERPVEMEISPIHLARQTAGLSLAHVESILLQARRNGSLTRNDARSIKDQMIAGEYAGLVQTLNPDYGFSQVGGMERLKDWSRREIIDPIADGRLADCPKGVILAGPPGTGKTFFITALAAEIGFNAVSISMDRILGGIVGESERRMAQVIGLLKGLAPVLVFMDEIDQSDISQRGNGSGNPVAANLFNQMLQFLGDESNRGRVLFFAASNRPDLLDSALVRSGRIDAIIPVLLPNEGERIAILAAQAKRQNCQIEPDALDLIVSNTENYSAADLTALVTKARKLAARTGQLIDLKIVTQALAYLKPNTLVTADYYTRLAIQAVNDLELLPPEYAVLRDDPQALADSIEASAKSQRKARNL